MSPFKGLTSRDHWRRFERRAEIGTQRALDLLDEYELHATFFVLGWVAEVAPELVREVAERGHEIAIPARARRECGNARKIEHLLNDRGLSFELTDGSRVERMSAEAGPCSPRRQ